MVVDVRTGTERTDELVSCVGDHEGSQSESEVEGSTGAGRSNNVGGFPRRG